MFSGLILCACPTPSPVHLGPHSQGAGDWETQRIITAAGVAHLILELLGPQTPTWAVHKAGLLPGLGAEGAAVSGQSLTRFCLLSLCVCVLGGFSRVQLFVTSWAVARQAPLSMGFSRQECWSGLPFPPPEDRPNPRIKPGSLTSPALAGGFFTTRATWEAQIINMAQQIGQFDELKHAEQNPRL